MENVVDLVDLATRVMVAGAVSYGAAECVALVRVLWRNLKDAYKRFG